MMGAAGCGAAGWSGDANPGSMLADRILDAQLGFLELRNGCAVRHRTVGFLFKPSFEIGMACSHCQFVGGAG